MSSSVDLSLLSFLQINSFPAYAIVPFYLLKYVSPLNTYKQMFDDWANELKDQYLT